VEYYSCCKRWYKSFRFGNIGPEGAYPVMEGKALIYKYLGGVDAIPLVHKGKIPENF